MVHLVVVVLLRGVVARPAPGVRHLLTLIQPDKVILEVLDTMLAAFTSMAAAVVEHPQREVMLPLMELLTMQQVLV
tara:strand:- start:367 stop:594 length:228 start_codon:yes stop_codon:yes gene_type:complete